MNFMFRDYLEPILTFLLYPDRIKIKERRRQNKDIRLVFVIFKSTSFFLILASLV